MYQDFRKLLMSASASNRTKIISELLTWAGVPSTARPSRRILDAAGVRQMSSGGLVEIGGHSVSHPPLGKLPRADQQEELRKSKADLEELLGQPIVGLAYPHGNCTAETTRLARAAGYAYACGTNRAPVRRGSDLYQLPRVGVGNVRGTAFKSVLREFIPI